MKVPVYGGQKVEQKAIGNNRSNVNATAEAFGGGQANTSAEALSKTAGVALNVVEIEKNNDDNLANKAFKNEIDAFHTSQYKEDGAFQSKGTDAFYDDPNQENKNAPQRLKESFEIKKAELLAKASNDEQRAFINESATDSYNSMNKTMIEHGVKQKSQYDKEQTSASIKLSGDLATASYKDPEAVRKAMISQMQAISTYGHAEKMPPAQIEKLMSETMSGTSYDIVSRHVANNDIDAGRSYYEKNKGTFHGDDIIKTEKMLQESGNKVSAIKYADKIVNDYNDMSSALDAAKEIKDPEVREQAKSYIRVNMKEKNDNKVQVHDNDFMSAVDAIDKTGDVSPALTAKLTPDGKKALNDYMLHAKGVKEASPNNSFYLEYSGMPMAEMAKVSQVDMVKIKYSTTPDQFKNINEKWKLARDGLNGDDGAKAKYDATNEDQKNQLQSMKDAGVFGDGDTMASINGDSKKRKTLINFNQDITAEINKRMHNNGGKPISEGERREAADAVLKRTIKVETLFGFSQKEVSAVEVDETRIGKIKLDDREQKQMVNAGKANGFTPTKQNMQRAKLFAVKNGAFDTDSKRATLINILRGGK